MHGNGEKCLHLVGRPERERSLEKLGIHGRMWIGFIWLRVGRGQWWCVVNIV
jgi:hypothetical protein